MKKEILFLSHPYSPNFDLKWAEWIAYKKAIKKPYKLVRTQQIKIDQVVKAGFSEEEVIAAIDEAIGNEYLGFHPKKSTHGKGTQNNYSGSGNSQKLGTSSARIEALRNWGKV